jgi:predicted ATPase/DNA-binding SARP family transcriptional activator
VKFGILGPIEAWLDDERLTLGGPRQLSLFALLAVHANQAVSTDVLIDGVWGTDRGAATKRLSMAIARLRRSLEPLDQDGRPVLRTVSGGYMLAIPSDELDAELFDRLVRDGLHELGNGKAADAGEQLRAALALWRGPPLAEVGFADFAQPEIRRLNELRLAALEARIDSDLQLGADAALVGELAALVEHNPLREHLASQLMLALYRSGRQAEALEIYQNTRTRLNDELGLEPGPALRDLQAQILEQAPELGQSQPAMGGGRGQPAPGEAVTMVIAEMDTSEPFLLERGDAYRQVVSELRSLMRRVWDRRADVQVADRGDGLLAVFTSPRVALEAALEARDAPASVTWPVHADVRLRIGVHTGRLRATGGVYWGEDVHYAARVAGAAHGGQVLVSGATAALASEAMLVDLGEHRLDDFAVPRHLFGLGPGSQRVPRTRDPLRSNLPSARSELTGRDGERTELVATLSAGTSRLVTITGSGGSGKTSLALAAAEAVTDVLADGAYFVALAQVTDPSAVTAAIAAPLGIHLPDGGDQLRAIGQALADRELLLVLDNFEHLLDTAPLLADLLALAPQLRIMVTSQAPLRLSGERVLALGPLAVPQADDRAAVAAAPASRLLLERARQADPSFELTADNAASLARLCRALGGLPLAIELAAARLTLLTPSELLARLDDGIEAVGRGPRDLPARQRGLRAALEWTHSLLNHDQAKLLRDIGAFAGPVSLERIERVCGDGVDLLEPLARLVELSLVIRTGDGRFVLHAGVRDYAREKLATTADGPELARRHCEGFAEAADGWGSRFLFDAGEVQAAVLREEADIEQALTWSAAADHECFARLVGGAAMPLLFASRLPPWAELIEQVLASADVTTKSKTWLLLAASLAALQRQDVPLAGARLASTIDTAEQADNPWLTCVMRACSIIFHVLTGTTAGVRDEHSRLSERVAEVGDRKLAALVVGLEPYVLAYCERRYADAAAIWSALMADPTRTDFAGWTALFCWPDCSLLAGDYRTALDGYRAALRSARERVQPNTVAYQIEGMVIALSGLGRHDEAVEAAGWAGSVRQTAGPAMNTWYKELLDNAMDQSRTVLGARRANAAYLRGRALTLDSAVNAGLEVRQIATRR